MTSLGSNSSFQVGHGVLIFQPQTHKNKDGKKFYKASATTVRNTYPLRLLLPKHASSNECQWVFPINYGAGLVEGDQVYLDVTVGPHCCILITTQGSTKIYKCENKLTSSYALNCRVGENSFLAILPDPVVCYAESYYSQEQIFKITKSSNLVLLDWVLSGRVANGESWDFNRLQLKSCVYIDDHLVFKDAMRLENTTFLTIKESMKDYQVIGFCVIIGPLLESVIINALQIFSRPGIYGAKPSRNVIVGVSPLFLKSTDASAIGCVIRFGAQSTMQAYDQIKPVLEPLNKILGGDPFYTKY